MDSAPKLEIFTTVFMSMPLNWKISVNTMERPMMKRTAFSGELVRLFIFAMNLGRQPPLAMVNMTKAMEFCWAIAVNTPWASATPTAQTIISQGPAAILATT